MLSLNNKPPLYNPMKKKTLVLVIMLGLLGAFLPSIADDKKEKKNDAIAGLLNSLKDSVKDSGMGADVAKLPQQFKLMQANYVQQTKALKKLQEQVAALQVEVEQLKAQVSSLQSEEIKLKPVE